MAPRAACLASVLLSNAALGMKLQPSDIFDIPNSTVSAVQLKDPRPDGAFASGGETRGTRQLRLEILDRFKRTDANNDSVVTMPEMREGGFGQATGEAGERVLLRMLASCAGTRLAVENCSYAEMEASLQRWTSREVRTALRHLRGGSRNWEDIDAVSLAADQAKGGFNGTTSTRCGPLKVSCFIQGRKCWKGDGLAAWNLMHVCSTAACVCEPSAQTKRFAKLAVAAALSVGSVANFSDTREDLPNPACGGDWHGEKVLGRLSTLNDLSEGELREIGVTAIMQGHDEEGASRIAFEGNDETEVAVWRSNRQQIVKNGRAARPVCVISWQATRSTGDWKTNFMTWDQDFEYGPPGVDIKLPKGLALAYRSTREKLKKVFDKLCCTWFPAAKLVISGHSHGGAMAVINAIDVISKWKCAGQDLTADDVALITEAPHKQMLHMSVVNEVFSCMDKANCLAGSVATLVANGDVVGDAREWLTAGEPFQPSIVTFLPCPPMAPEDKLLGDPAWWCHSIQHYTRGTETVLVDAARWGSTCGGECGDLNYQLSCYSYATLTHRGCYSAKSDLKDPKHCRRWDAEKEHCACAQQSCNEMLAVGCAL